MSKTCNFISKAIWDEFTSFWDKIDSQTKKYRVILHRYFRQIQLGRLSKIPGVLAVIFYVKLH